MRQNATQDLECCKSAVDAYRQPPSGSCPDSRSPKTCPVAIQFPNGLSCLTFVNVTKNAGGQSGFDTVVGQLDQALSERWYHRCFVKMFIKVLAGTAEVQHVSKIS